MSSKGREGDGSGGKGAGAAHPPSSTKKRPASPEERAPNKPPTAPLHDDHLPVDVVEEGRIFFFYRPRVAPARPASARPPAADDAEEDTATVLDLDDVARSFILLEPLAASDRSVGEGREALAAAEKRDPAHARPLNRMFVLPKKALPGRSGEARLAICVAAADSVGALTSGLGAKTYETKTRGPRVEPAARVAAKGAYMIVAPTAGPGARAAHKAQAREEEEEAEEKEGGTAEKAGEEEEEEAAAAQPPKKKQKDKKETAAEAAGHHGRPVASSRLLWLLEAPRRDGPAQEMMAVEHRGAFVIKVKGPLGGRGGGWAPPPPKPGELPGPARARLAAARTQWVDVDTHAALDYKGAQMLMVAQYAAGGGGGGPGALEAGGGGVAKDRAAMAEEAGPEAAAALAKLVSDDARALEADARAHGEPARARGGHGLDGALRRALLAELTRHGHDGGGGGELAAAHREEAEAQLRLHERQEREEEGEGEAEEGAGGAAGVVLEPAITGEIV
jgi:hypothetical protein